MFVHRSCLLVIALITGAAPVATTNAAEHEHEGEDAHEESHAASHEYHANTLGLFLGVTQEGRAEDFTIGLEYERRLNKSFGIGAVAEYVSGDLDFWVYAVPFAYHTGPWKFYVAPGIEDGEEDSDFLVRVGGEYAFELGKWEVSPQIDLDFVDNNEVWVLGIVIGRGF